MLRLKGPDKQVLNGVLLDTELKFPCLAPGKRVNVLTIFRPQACVVFLYVQLCQIEG